MDTPSREDKPEIEVTPEMIEAGLHVLWGSGAVENPMDGVDQELVRKIFSAMSHVSRAQS
jgi:hypothetical protein